MRKRLDFDRPVDRSTIEECLDIALQAPTGSLASYLSENFDCAPWLLVPCIEEQLDGVNTMMAASAWGSILPAVWSFMLALRERGLGSAWTTIHLMNGGDQEAAELLGIPHDRYTQAGLFPIPDTQDRTR